LHQEHRDLKVMKKIVLKFGLSSAVSMAVMYVFMCLARNNGNTVLSEALVYAAVVLLFILLFWGIKSYRDNALSGFITFGEAFKVGILISLISSLGYTMLWIILYNPIFKDFMQQHATALMEKLNASGVSVQEIAAKKEEMSKHTELYKKPLFRAAVIFIQGFPVEAIMAVIASFMLKKKQPGIA